MLKKIATATEKTTTMRVSLIVCSFVGQFTFFVSSLTSFKKLNNLEKRLIGFITFISSSELKKASRATLHIPL